MKIFRIVANLVIASVLLLGVLGPACPIQAKVTYHAQPFLIALAEKDPQQVVSVIVQKAVAGSSLEDWVARLGGEVTQDLHIINAFAARMPAEAALSLSGLPETRWVSLDAPMTPTACTECVDTSTLANSYIKTINADKVWNVSPYIQGKGIGVAVVDSGINPNGDLYTNMGVNRQVADIRFNTDYNQSVTDGYGHGTHVSSIIAGDGSESGGKYIGVAPMANIINVKVSNDDGSATMLNVIEGLQWVLENKDAYNIRVVNLSLNSSVAESYNTNPLDAAVEILWFNGIVVVVSAGNQASGILYPPANDPFVITVGATDDKGTSSINDDVVASFSAYGVDEDGVKKPDLVAPGKNIIARLVNTNMGVAGAHPTNVINRTYFRMSGTSMAAPMVSGAVALLLQDEPNLTPDQVKFRLKATAKKDWAGYNSSKAGAGCLDVSAALSGTTTQSANTGNKVSDLLTTGDEPVNSTVSWNSVSWNSVSWNSVSWNSVSWNSVSWNSVSWNSVSWNSDYWGN